MKFQVIATFPEFIQSFAQTALLGRAVTEGKVEIDAIGLRDFAINTQGQIDDSPYGGGSGMVLRPESAVAAIESAKAKDPEAKVVLLTPRGRTFNQATARRLAQRMSEKNEGLIILCCRYEGVDERVVEHWVDEEIAIGDYVLMGGEVAAMALMEAVGRLLPGVLGNPESIANESFEQGLLEHPHYTKPAEFRGLAVPEVLRSGHHAEIEKWRKERSLADTAARRPDLYEGTELPSCEINIALIHYPVVDKHGDTIVSSITNIDLHDIARSATTFGVKHYYVVHPTKALRRLSERICEHWDTGHGAHYNPNRREALQMLRIVVDLQDVLLDIEQRTGKLPLVVTTSARDSDKAVSFGQLRQKLYQSDVPVLILFGTGWGLGPEIMERADLHLEPVKGLTPYNHLSVRGAAAIIFDRLLGKRSPTERSKI